MVLMEIPGVYMWIWLDFYSTTIPFPRNFASFNSFVQNATESLQLDFTKSLPFH